MQRTLPLFALCGALLLDTSSANAQGWVGVYSPDRLMGINGMLERPDGNFLVTGYNPNDPEDGTRVMLISATGTALAAMDHDSLFSITNTTRTSDGGFAIIGSPTSAGPDWNGRAVLRVDADGQELWFKHIDQRPFSGLGNLAIDAAPDGGFFCVFHPQDVVLDHRVVMVKRLDANGDVLWERSYYESDPLVYTYEIECTPDGGAVISLQATDNTTDQLFKVDADGNVAWTYTLADDARFLFPVIASDGNILVSGPLDTGGTVIKKLDQDGNELWSTTYPPLDNDLSFQYMIEEAPDRFVGIGLKHVGGTAMALIRLDDAGNILLQQPLPLDNLGLGLTNHLFLMQHALVPTSDGGYLCGGWIAHNDPTIPGSGFLVKMDAQGRVYPGLLGGVPFADQDPNCEQDTTKIALDGTVLSFSNGSETFHAVAAEGRYRVGLHDGSYAVDATPISPYWRLAACNPSSVALPASGDTTVSFGFTPLVNAPYITMDGYTRMRLCTPSTYTLHYCNTGTEPFQGVITVRFDADAVVDSASVPWLTNSGGVVVFAETDLEVAQCRTIQVHFSRSCDMALMGRTFCIEADAYPKDMLLPGPTWDSSNLLISAVHNLTTDSVEFTVINTGGAMATFEDLLLYADDDLHATIPLQLDGGGVEVHAVPANGTTWRGTISQTPGNPNSAFATVALEGAGTHADGSISLGFVDDFPLYGQYAFHHTTCSQVLNAYDPNRKTVVPEGIGPDHLVDSTTTLEYTLEFQNTGTAEAYVVRLVDTLASPLDPITIVPGAASHPYTWRFLSSNVVEFLFEGIHLPDSTTNEPESHGFVRFRIAQRHANPAGTVINNEAGIYFDFNPPVITNTATVKVGAPAVTEVGALPGSGTVLRAYPNPFSESTTIVAEGAHGPLLLTMMDALGRTVKRQAAYNTDRFILDRHALPTGQYLFEVRSNGEVIGHGRVTVQ